MRVLLLGTRMDLISGHSRPAYELGSALRGQGHQVRLLSTPLAGPRRRRHARLRRREAHLALPSAERHLPTSRTLLAPWSRLTAVRELVAWADVVHGFSFWTALLVRRRVGKAVPFVLSLNTVPAATLDDFRSSGRLAGGELLRPSSLLALTAGAFLVRRGLRGVDRLLSWTAFLQEQMEAIGVSPRAIARVPVGLDLRRFNVRPASLPGSPSLLFFGLVKPGRGPEIALSAFDRVRASLPKAELILADRGHHQEGDRRYLRRERDHLRSQIRSRGLERSVHIRSFDDQMLATLAGADAVVLPFSSAYGYSQPPLTVLEALALGKPVISTTVGSLPEIIDRPELGSLVPPEDPEAVAEAILAELEADDGQRRRARRGAIELRHSWADSAQAIVAEYERLLIEDSRG